MAPFLTTERDRGFCGDRISGLPNDIILTFLSPIGMKEAARTSILSKRWRYLWATRTHLDFDPKHHELDIVYSTQKDKYINWVNQVVGFHWNACIDTFRIHLGFYRGDSGDSSDSHHFDRWVKFALSRKVKNLELNTCSYHGVYTLGFDILKHSVGIGDSGITSLTSLHLTRVDVSGDFIEFLLSKCRHLERLYVRVSPLLVRLKVIGLSLKLKQLTILDCYNLKELEIDDVNDLTYFNYSCCNPEMNFVLKSMPMLVEATFAVNSYMFPARIFKQISHLASQLLKLTIDMKETSLPRASLPIFSNLKHFDLVIHDFYARVDDLTLFLEACPMLHEFKLQVMWGRHTTLDEAYLLVEMDLCHSEGLGFGVDGGFELEKQNTHPNLTLLEVVGYMGCDYDIDIILFVMASACKLETIICNCNYETQRKYLPDELVETGRARACKLKKSISPKICVIII